MKEFLKNDLKLLPLIFVGMLMFFTVFVKGVPVITLINEKIGGDKFHPSSKAIIIEGSLFVVRSVVKFVVMNPGCALSDHIGRKPITLFFILPNICMDGMLLFADITPSIIFTFGALWGLTSITLPTLRAWVCDLCGDDPIEMVNAQGSFRGLTIGPAFLLGIPLGTVFALYSNPKYAFICSMFANILSLIIISTTKLDDTIGIAKQQQTKNNLENKNKNSIEMTFSEDSPHLRFTEGGTSIITLPSESQPESQLESQSNSNSNSKNKVKRSFPSEGMCKFCWEHSPWSGYEVIVELYEKNPSASCLWLVYFFTFCANEVLIL